MLQETPAWLPEIVGCSREVLECPGQVLGCPGDMHGCPSKVLVQHGEVFVCPKDVIDDTG